VNLVVLYVEDDELSCEIMQLLLEGEMGSQVIIFQDSSDFLARVQALQSKPDVVLLDIHVKPHNGFEMLTMLRSLASFRTVPIVALTASVMNEEVQQLKSAGFNSIIAKPIDQDTFGCTLNRIVKGEHQWHTIT
jgi:CheY-like chemotaxis protein